MTRSDQIGHKSLDREDEQRTQRKHTSGGNGDFLHVKDLQDVAQETYQDYGPHLPVSRTGQEFGHDSEAR